MPIRIQRYVSPLQRLQLGGVDPGAPRARVDLSAGSASDRSAEALLDAGRKLTGIAVQEYVRDETARVSQSLLSLQQELSAERERYIQEHQGQDALDAGEHFGSFARETVRKLQEEGKFSGRFADMFASRAAGMALHFTEQGQRYGRQQKAIWHQSVAEGCEAAALDAIAADYDNPEYYHFTVAEHEKLLDGIFAGQDTRALKRQFRKRAAASALRAALDAGDKNAAARLRERCRPDPEASDIGSGG